LMRVRALVLVLVGRRGRREISFRVGVYEMMGVWVASFLASLWLWLSLGMWFLESEGRRGVLIRLR
jgi:hypothetical protein